jgi:hypothetical protein
MVYADQPRLSRAVPRLKGKSNWMPWSDRLLTVLKENEIYRDILTGVTRCPDPLTGEGVTEAEQAKQAARIAEWKANNYHVRVYLGSTLDEEPAAEIKDIYDTHQAYHKLEILFSENRIMSGSRCWSDWTNLTYDKSRISALDFVRQFQQAIFQLKTTQRPGLGPKQQLPQFLQTINTPGFAEFLASIDPDFDHPGLMELAFACFLQFTESDGNPDPAVFGQKKSSIVPPDTAQTPIIIDKPSPSSSKSSKNDSKGKKRSNDGSGEPQVIRRPQLSAEAKRMLQMSAVSVATPHPDKSPSNKSANGPPSAVGRPSSPLFVDQDQDGDSGEEDDEGLPMIIDESTLDSAARF